MRGRKCCVSCISGEDFLREGDGRRGERRFFVIFLSCEERVGEFFAKNFFVKDDWRVSGEVLGCDLKKFCEL